MLFRFRPASRRHISAEVLFHWLAHILGSAQACDQWIQLAAEQRQPWLDDDGHDYNELKQSLHTLAAGGETDPALLAALEGFLHHGQPIPAAQLEAVHKAIDQVVGQVEATAGGLLSMQALRIGNRLRRDEGLIGRSRAVLKESAALAEHTQNIINESSVTKLGRYVELGGSIANDVYRRSEHQVEEKEQKISNLAEEKKLQAAPIVKAARSQFNDRRNRFESQAEDRAVSKEVQLINEARATPAPTLQARAETLRSNGVTLGSKEQALWQLDSNAFNANDRAALHADLPVKPSATVSGAPGSRSVSLTYDWKGARGTAVFTRQSGHELLGPANLALRTLNRFSARALWQQHLREEEAAASRHVFPKQTPKAVLAQAQQHKQSWIATAQAKRRQAERHGVTLESLQRHHDQKLLKRATVLQLHRERHRLERQGKALAGVARTRVEQKLRSALITAARQRLATDSALTQRLAPIAPAASGLRKQLGQADASISYSGRHLDLSWSQGEGLSLERAAKQPSAYYSSDPSLSIEAKSATQNTIELGAIDHDGLINVRFRSSDQAGDVVHQASRSFRAGQAWGQDLEQARSQLGSRAAQLQTKVQTVKDNLRQAALKTARKELKSPSDLVSDLLHSPLPSLPKAAQLLHVAQQGRAHATALHHLVHDVAVDRRIDARISGQVGSLRAQKIILSHAIREAALIEDGATTSLARLHATGEAIHNGTFAANSKLRRELAVALLETRIGIKKDKEEKADLAKIKGTSPYQVEKNSTGTGYQFVSSSQSKDYWQKLSEKQRYGIFNPLYHSEKIFYNAESASFQVACASYVALRKAGASEKAARLAASAAYFNALLKVDRIDLSKAHQNPGLLQYAPFVFKRQLRVAKEVIYLNRHSTAWQLRVSYKMKRQRFLYTKMTKEENYMLNNKFTGFHPIHRVARKTVHHFKWMWHHTIGNVWRHEAKWVNDAIGMVSPKAANWIGGAEYKISKTITFIGWHIVKGLWHMPERLVEHTKYFGKQLLFCFTHPFAYKKKWDGLMKDTKGVRHMAKFAVHFLAWSDSVFFRSIYQLGRTFTGQGGNWNTVFKGAYHKKLYKKAMQVHYAWKFAGLASLVGHTDAGKAAIKLDMMKRQIRSELHQTGFVRSPLHHFISTHSKLVKKASSFAPAGWSDLPEQISGIRHNIKSHWLRDLSDFKKYKSNSTYHNKVNARGQAMSSQWKPKAQTYLHTTIHEVLNDVSGIQNKSMKIKLWTVAQLNQDLTEYMRLRQGIKGLSTPGKKELGISFLALRAATKASAKGEIKIGMQNLNSNIGALLKPIGTFRKNYTKTVKQDWNSVGSSLALKLQNTLVNSIQSSAAQKAVKSVLHSNDVGQSIFDDIVGGFVLHHYLSALRKDPALVATLRTSNEDLHAATRRITAFTSQPVVHKVLAHWLKLNQNSLIAKDYRKVQSYRQGFQRQLKKWQRVERIGHTQVSWADLTTLSSLHKNGQLAPAIARLVTATPQWSRLTPTRQGMYSAMFQQWLLYNQTSRHELQKATARTQSHFTAEWQGWTTDKAEIASGESLSVGALLLSVKQNDKNAGGWTTIPKVSRSDLAGLRHGRNLRAGLSRVAADPHLLSVAFTTSHGSSTPAHIKPAHDAQLLQYYQQLKMIKHRLSPKKKAEEAKKEADSAKAKGEETKQNLEAEGDGKSVETKAETQLETRTGAADGQALKEDARLERERLEGHARRELTKDTELDDLGKVVRDERRGDAGDLINNAESELANQGERDLGKMLGDEVKQSAAEVESSAEATIRTTSEDALDDAGEAMKNLFKEEEMVEIEVATDAEEAAEVAAL